jgi:glycosyltransferase involved in cell wall biosynthesis
MAIKVSVCIFTYNQEKFIAQAIDGVLMQEVDFDYEIIVGEDDSTDNTRNIVKEYKKRYPDRIRLFLNDRKNVIYVGGRPTGRWNLINSLEHAKGEYIALLDGDDYWTDPHKLQKQVDFLDSHPDFTICSHNVYRKYEDQDREMVEWPGSELKEIITLEDMLGGGYAVPTCSLIFRNNALGGLPDWFSRVAAAHTVLQILCASKGKMRYFREVMGVYRIHPGGICSGVKPDSQEEIDRFDLGVKKVEIINRHFDYRYDELIRRSLARYYYPNLVRAHFRNWRRNVEEAGKYAREIVKEDPSIYRISMRRRIKLVILIVVSDILILLSRIIGRFLV